MLSGKNLNERIYEAIVNHENNIIVNATPSHIDEVITNIMDEHFDIFWFDGKWSVEHIPGGKKISFEYTVDKKQMTENIEKLNQELEKFDKIKDYDAITKCRYVYEWFFDNVSYGGGKYNGQTIYEAIVEKKALCEGLSKAYSVILSRLGIKVGLERGTIDGITPHTWNSIVGVIGFETYYVDISLAYEGLSFLFDERQQKDRYRGFFITEATLNKTNSKELYVLPQEYAKLGIVRKIGQGSFGTVYSIKGEKDFVLKVIECEKNDSIYSRELKEIEILKNVAKLEHAVHIYDYKIEEKGDSAKIYIIMELCKTFTDYVNEKGKMQITQIIELVKKMCIALNECYKVGVIHGDVQPKNFFMNGDDIKVGDFNLSFEISKEDTDENSDSNDNIVGTMLYMAPEVYREGRLSILSDIYSLGVILYELLNGNEYMFSKDKNPKIAIYKRLSGTKFNSFTSFSKEVRDTLMEAVEKATAFDTTKRIQSYEEFIEILEICKNKISSEYDKEVNITLYGSRWVEIFGNTLILGKTCLSNNIDIWDDADWSDANESLIKPIGPIISNSTPIATSIAISSSTPIVARRTIAPISSSVAITGNTTKNNKTESKSDDVSNVDVSAVCEKALTADSSSELNIIMYEEAFRKVVDEIISSEDTSHKEKRLGKIRLNDECRVRIELTSDDVEIEDNVIEQIWYGDYAMFTFIINTPKEFKKDRVVIKGSVYVNELKSMYISLFLDVNNYVKHVNVDKKMVESAFVSYSRKDIVAVTNMIQGMRKINPDIDIFMDVEKLESGEYWENVIKKEIDSKDVLYLCWSTNAMNSEWVDKEWRYAYETKGIDFIDPLPVELPNNCPPPKELSQRHFTDKYLFIKNAYLDVLQNNITGSDIF